MKKKIYFAPETTIVEIELQRMIALSLIDEDADPDGEVLGREEEFEDEEDYAGGRRHHNGNHNVWDDEKELQDLNGY